jgi:4-hydroxy-3-methylbut-2-enyl diphosphate reductase IspH
MHVSESILMQLSAEEICNATSIRQEGVMNLKNIDLLIVVGDSRSNNSNQLKEIGLHSGVKEAILIDSVQDLKEDHGQRKGPHCSYQRFFYTE